MLLDPSRADAACGFDVVTSANLGKYLQAVEHCKKAGVAIRIHAVRFVEDGLDGAPLAFFFVFAVAKFALFRGFAQFWKTFEDRLPVEVGDSEIRHPRRIYIEGFLICGENQP